MPVKRTALGRFKHDSATVHDADSGHVVVYSGDDERGEYLYKYVSGSPWRHYADPGDSLDDGTLYVARFDADGTGQWLAIDPARLVETRLAAADLRPTRMDRPEWAAVDPVSGAVYVTLTNNRNRGGEESQLIDAANPRYANPWGHIVRWTEGTEAGGDLGDHTATSFTWEIFHLAGPGDGADQSTIDGDEAFGSPDGLGFDAAGRLYIQTDGTQPVETNDQMLLSDPSAEGREMARFLTGPRGCEVTGLTFTPDHRWVFVNIQHPGDEGTPEDPTAQSDWPSGVWCAARDSNPEPAG